MAAAQHGVVSRAQLLEVGLSRHAIDARLRRGRLHLVHRGVYTVGHPLLGFRGRWLAAVLACGSCAALSHRSAAALWDLRRSDSARIEVTVPTRGGRRRRSITIHRVPALPAEEVTCHEEVPVTTPARTLLDLAAVVSRSALKNAVEQGERLRLFDLRAVEGVLARNANRPGARALSAILADWVEPPFTRSDLEKAVLAICADRDLPKPSVNAIVAGYEVDFLWRKAGLIVEADGRETHLTSAAFERDRARDAHLTVLGYRVVRFTYSRVLYDPEAVARTLASLLSSAQPRSISSTR